MNADNRSSPSDLHIVPNIARVFEYSGSCCNSKNQSFTKKNDSAALYGSISWPSSITGDCASNESPECSPNLDLNQSSEAGVDELDDMLCRFDTFFREKVNTELQSLQEFMHGLLSEQQIHLRQILRSNINMSPAYETCVQVNNKTPEGLETAKSLMSLEEAEMPYSTDMGKLSGTQVKQRLLLELLALSCQVSALLSGVKFY